MRLRLRFAAPVLLACSIVTAAWVVPAAGSGDPPATSPPLVAYSGHTTDHHAELVKAIQMGLAQQAIDIQTWNTAVAANEAQRQAEAANVATAKRPAGGSSPTGPSLTAASSVGGGDVEDAVRKYFGDIFDQAWGSDHNYGVTRCESGHNPGARNGPNYGLFQISNVHAAEFERVTGRSFYDAWSDPLANAQYARALYDESGGWGPWSCRWAA